MSLIDHLKRGTLEDIQTTCVSCKKSVCPAHAPHQVNRTPSMDTYFFYCVNCGNILTIDYDYKDGSSSDERRLRFEFM